MANTTNKKSRKVNKLMLTSLIILAIAIIIPTSLAWFTDQRQAEGTVTFGKIEITDKSGYNGTATVKALPGQSFAGANNCSVALAAASSPAFIRAKISATFTNLTANKTKKAEDGTDVSVPFATINSAMATFATELNTLLNNKIKTTVSDGYAWTAYNGYYYLVSSGTAGAGVPLKTTSTTSAEGITYTFILKADMVIPTGLTNPSAVVTSKTVKNLQYGEVVNIRLIFESVQADYLPTSGTVANIASYFTATP